LLKQRANGGAQSMAAMCNGLQSTLAIVSSRAERFDRLSG
jgi:hypothetical protein